jgi:hypothetical protein
MKAAMVVVGVVLICRASVLGQIPQGQWDEFYFNFGPSLQDRIVAIHLIHVYDPYTGSGKVIAINRYHYVLPPSPCYAPEVRYWTPPAANAPPGFPGTFESIPNWRTDVFCSGHSALADGRILTVGGHFGCHDHTDIFDPEVFPLSE